MEAASAAILLGVVGAVSGSFVSTAALRSAAGEQVLRGRSRCDGCGRSLGWAQTIPIIAYAVQRGRCATCKGRISLAHPAGEIGGGVAAFALGLIAPLSDAFAMTIMAAALLAAAIIDAKTQRLPNPLTSVVALCATFLSLRSGLTHFASGLIAAGLSTVVLLLLRRAFLRRRGEPSLGLGDVKLIAALAIWLGPLTPMMVAAASGVALLTMVVRPGTTGRIAFGPMLALCGWGLGLAVELGFWPS